MTASRSAAVSLCTVPVLAKQPLRLAAHRTTLCKAVAPDFRVRCTGAGRRLLDAATATGDAAGTGTSNGPAAYSSGKRHLLDAATATSDAAGTGTSNGPAAYSSGRKLSQADGSAGQATAQNGRKLSQADGSAGQTVSTGRKLSQADGSAAQTVHSGRKLSQADGSAGQATAQNGRKLSQADGSAGQATAQSGRRLSQADGSAAQTVNSGGATAPSVRHSYGLRCRCCQHKSCYRGVRELIKTGRRTCACQEAFELMCSTRLSAHTLSYVSLCSS